MDDFPEFPAPPAAIDPPGADPDKAPYRDPDADAQVVADSIAATGKAPLREPEYPPLDGSWEPTPAQRQLAVELLMLQGVTVDMAARCMGIMPGRFRRRLSREIAEAARAMEGAGGKFSVTRELRERVKTFVLCGFEIPVMARMIIVGGMDEEAFRKAFAHELEVGDKEMIAAMVRRFGHIAVHGARDSDARAAARFVMETKGKFARPTRKDKVPGTTPGDRSRSTKELQDELAAAIAAQIGITPDAANAALDALASQGSGPARRTRTVN